MSRPVRPHSTAAEPPATPSPAWLFFIGLLLAARYLQPTEAVVFGETLWQAQLWLAASAVWCWTQFRSGRFVLRWSLLDLLLWGLVLGHALSTAVVFLEGGDRRAAVNIAWEWAGLAATFFVLRQILASDAIGRTMPVVAAVMVSIAALGIWQHHVSQPQTAARYESLWNEAETLGELIERGQATPSQRARFSEVHDELAAFGVPIEASARKRWEDRLLYSSEAFGTFGLANTLGGLLAAALPFIVLSIRKARRSPAVLAGLMASTGLVLYCLVLTKSRTAWVGLLAGSLAVAALHAIRGRGARNLLGPGVAVFGGTVLLLGIVYLAGGIDRQVFSEAPKSLQYRLDYWSGALDVLKERPLLGTGPANFRTHYLEHRPPGASEAVAAPHNLLLDVWTAGGLLSLVMLLAFLGVVLTRFVRMIRDAALTEHATTPSGWSPLETGALVAFPVVVAVYFLTGNGIDQRLLAIAPVAGISLFCLIRFNARAAVVVGAGTGLVALIVHLLGADGIELPAVLQTLFLFAAVIDRPLESRLRAVPVLPLLGLGALTVGCLLSGLVPVLNAAALTTRGEQLVRQGNPVAERFLEQAAEADPLAMRPIELLAELATSRALSSGSRSDRQAAERRWQTVLDVAPRHLHARAQLAELALASGGGAGADEAAALLAEAVALSPTDAELRARAASAFEAVGNAHAASKHAREALRLDDLNRAAGHVDLTFETSSRRALERLTTIGQSLPEP